MKPLNPLFLKIDQLLLDDPDHYYTYQEILEANDGKKFEHTARRTDTVKGHKYYQALQDAVKLIKKQLKAQGLSLDYKNGKDASEGFRYPRGVEDPMAAKKSNNQQMRTTQLKRLIEASAGLFPSSWLADMLAGAQCLGVRGEKVILFDQNIHLENLKWVPTFFDAIEKRLVLQFEYNPNYGETKEMLLFHPYYLKEYNQRWFIFGKSTNLAGKSLPYSNCAIDRIVGEVEMRDDVEYIPSKTKDFAATYFKDIVGVTRKKNKKPVTILIATNDAQTHGRIMTKPIHTSQHELESFSVELGRRGLISFAVIPNDELDTLLMSFGAGIEVLGEYRETFMRKVEALKNLYFPQNPDAEDV